MTASGQKKRLRIAIFTAEYAPHLSGVSVAVHQRVCWLLQQGHEVFLVHPTIDSQYPANERDRSLPGVDELKPFSKFSAYAYPTSPLIFDKYCPEPRHYRYWNDTELLENFQPDVVVVEGPLLMRGFWSFFLGGYGRPIGIQYAQRTGTPTIAVYHTDILAYSRYYIGSWFMKSCRPILSAFLKGFSEQYDVNYFVSKQMLARYRTVNVQHSECFPVVGVDCQKFHPQNLRYNPIPDDRRPTLLFVGRIVPEKNVTQLLDAFPYIVAEIPNVHLVFVGSGSQLEEIRQRAAEYGSSITVWGETTGTELLGWFARADVFVNPSCTENFCQTNLEALASGTPVVAARGGGNPEQVVHGCNGFLAETDDPIDFAKKAIAILKDAALKAEMAKQARPSVQKFDWSVLIEKFENKLYQLILSKPNRVLTKI